MNKFFIDEMGIVKLCKYDVTVNEPQVIYKTKEKEIKKIIPAVPAIIDVNDNTVYSEKIPEKEITEIVSELVQETIINTQHFYFTSEKDKNAFLVNLNPEQTYEVEEIDTSDIDWISGLQFKNDEDVNNAIKLGEINYLYPLDKCIQQTKLWVEQELAKGIEINGKHFTCTLEKQNLLSMQLGMYTMNKQLGQDYVLMWNETGKPCEQWEYEDLLFVSNKIAEHVTPIVKKQQEAEVALANAKTVEEYKDILKDFPIVKE